MNLRELVASLEAEKPQASESLVKAIGDTTLEEFSGDQEIAYTVCGREYKVVEVEYDSKADTVWLHLEEED
jgi:hypothetical protein